jgi:hypothetical protein
VLKKAGIVVAAAAAGLLAVSPLAFAGEKDWGHASHQGGDSYSKDADGFLNVSNNNIAAPISALNCEDVDLGLINVPLDHNVVPLTGALGLFGNAKVKNKTYVDNSCDASITGTKAGDDTSQ